MAEHGNQTAQSILDKSGIEDRTIFDYKKTEDQYKAVSEQGQLQDVRRLDSRFNQAFTKTVSGCLINFVAHECSHANQQNNGRDMGLQSSKSSTPEELEKDKDYFETKDENGLTKYDLLLSKQNFEAGYAADVIDEAAVMASAYVAFMATNPSPEAIDRVNEWHKFRLTDGHTMEKTFNDFKANNPNGDNQALARCIFSRLVEDYGKVTLEKKQDRIASLDYNNDDGFAAIKGSYMEHIFGSVKDYIGALKQGGVQLTDENITALEKFAEINKRVSNVRLKRKNMDEIASHLDDDDKEKEKREKEKREKERREKEKSEKNKGKDQRSPATPAPSSQLSLSMLNNLRGR